MVPKNYPDILIPKCYFSTIKSKAVTLTFVLFTGNEVEFLKMCQTLLLPWIDLFSGRQLDTDSTHRFRMREVDVQLCPIKRGLYKEPFTLHLNLTGNGPKYHTGAIIAMLPSLKLAQYLAKETANECNYCVQRGAECHVS